MDPREADMCLNGTGSTDNFHYFAIASYTSFVLIIPILFFLILSKIFNAVSDSDSPAGCRKLGLINRSNFEDQFQTNLDQEQSWSIKALVVYPVKSCAPVELDRAEVVRTGLKYDRQFSFAQLVSSLPREQQDGSHKVDHKWRFITQREFPLLTMVKTELWIPDETVEGYSPDLKYVKSGGCIKLSFPFTPEVDFSLQGLRNALDLFKAKINTMKIDAQPLKTMIIPYHLSADSVKGSAVEKMMIWNEYHSALNIGAMMPENTMVELKYFLGVHNPFTLFRTDPDQYREVFRCAPTKSEIGYQPIVGMADAYPLHILGLPSVREVEKRLPKAEHMPLDISRFRANIIELVSVTGPIPFAEDKWSRIRILSSHACQPTIDAASKHPAKWNEYHVSCRTARCKLPNINPTTGLRSRNEPYVSMTKYRRIDAGAQPYPCLGMQSCPMWDAGMGNGPGDCDRSGWISAGDRIEILEETENHCYIPQ